MTVHIGGPAGRVRSAAFESHGLPPDWTRPLYGRPGSHRQVGASASTKATPIELVELLTFLADWLCGTQQHTRADSLTAFVGHTAQAASTIPHRISWFFGRSWTR
jgi:hypothetical protein